MADGYDALFCDLWGCLHNGAQPLPGRGRRVAGVSRGRRPGRSHDQRAAPNRYVAEQLGRLGVPARRLGPDRRQSGDAAQAGHVFRARSGERSIIMGPRRITVSSPTSRLNSQMPPPSIRVAAGGGRGHRLHRPVRRPDRNARGLPRDVALREDQGVEAPLRQSRYRRRSTATSGSTAPARLPRFTTRWAAKASTSASRIRRSTTLPAARLAATGAEAGQ